MQRYLSVVWNVGLEWEQNLKRGEVESTIRRLMVNEEGKEKRQKAIEFRKNIEFYVRQWGSSYNSLIDLVNILPV